MADPDSIPNLTGWWDASDTSTITENPSGRCQAITNKGTTAKTYEQTVLANKPTIVTVGGIQALHFNGAAYWMADVESNDVLQPGSGDFTVFASVRVTASSDIDHILWVQADGSSPAANWLLTLNTSILIGVADGVDIASVTGADETFDDGTTTWVVMAQRDGSNFRAFYGSVSTPLAESASSPADISLIGSVDAVNSALGNFAHTQPAAFYWEGDLFQWGFYKRALSASERVTLSEGLLGLASSGRGGQRRGWRNPHRRKPHIMDLMAAKKGATRRLMRGIRRHIR